MHPSTVCRALQRLDLPRKKSLAAAERVEADRRAFRRRVARLDRRRFVFTDETGFHLAMTRAYGRAARGSAELADYYIGLLRPDALNVHTIHAELEGGRYLAVLDSLLDRMQTGARFVRLRDEAAALAGRELPICSVREGRLPGRAMPVALQGEEAGPPSG